MCKYDREFQLSCFVRWSLRVREPYCGLHHVNRSAQGAPLKTSFYMVKIGAYKEGYSLLFLLQLTKHRLLTLVGTASLRPF